MEHDKASVRILLRFQGIHIYEILYSKDQTGRSSNVMFEGNELERTPIFRIQARRKQG